MVTKVKFDLWYFTFGVQNDLVLVICQGLYNFCHLVNFDVVYIH